MMNFQNELIMSEKSPRYYINEIIQHWVLVLLVVFLAMTGFVQAKPLGSFSLWFTGILGGLRNVINSHRIAGIIFTVFFVIHLIQIIVSFFKGKRGMLLRPRDLRELIGKEPKGRFSLRHKLDYLAVFLGSIILIVSGITLMQPEFTANIFGGSAVAVFREIHFNEAIIATSIIIFWHLYRAHFHPSVTGFRFQPPREKKKK